MLASNGQPSTPRPKPSHTWWHLGWASGEHSFSTACAASPPCKHTAINRLTIILTASAIVFVWVPETKAIPIEGMSVLFAGPVRHAGWTQKKVYPPNGMPPLPERLVEATEHAHDKDLKGNDERLESV